MRGTRLYVATTVVALFVVGGGVLIFMTAGGGGRPRTVDVSVVGGKLTPAVITAREGDSLTINITADQEGEIHLHGYDIHFEGKPGEVRSRTFRADKSGTFELEFETGAMHLGNLVVSP